MSKLNTVQNGKGSKSRISDYKKFTDNYEQINWGLTKGDKDGIIKGDENIEQKQKDSNFF